MLRVSASAAAAAVAAPCISRAQGAVATVAYGLTSKTANDWINFLADKLGFFAANGVKMDFIVVGSAVGNGQQLAAGSLNLGGIASPDLIHAVIGGAPMACVLARTRASPYVIVAKKGYTKLQELKGKSVIVDSPNGITRLMVDGVLEANRMKGSDVQYTYAGGTPERFAALMSGAVDAAILLPPFSFRATSQGLPVLAEIPKVFPTLPVDQTAANLNWAKANPTALVGFLKGYMTGVRWIFNSANKSQAVSYLVELTNTTPEDAAKAYDVYVGGKVFSETGVTPIDGEAKVLTMLAKVGQVPPNYPPAPRYVDNHYIEQANAELKRTR
jgi:ABC-type nitrate/sulfonate/bicarbonate transport system substrate-binding protein